jgi:hypothetical protein
MTPDEISSSNIIIDLLVLKFGLLLLILPLVYRLMLVGCSDKLGDRAGIPGSQNQCVAMVAIHRYQIAPDALVSFVLRTDIGGRIYKLRKRLGVFGWRREVGLAGLQFGGFGGRRGSQRIVAAAGRALVGSFGVSVAGDLGGAG